MNAIINCKQPLINYIHTRSKNFFLVFLLTTLLYSHSQVLSHEISSSIHSTGQNHSEIANINHSQNTFNYNEVNNYNTVNLNHEINQIISDIVNSSKSLDLSSTLDSIKITNITQTINININNHLYAINNNQYVTPTESLALNQVLRSDHQSLILNSFGQAVGGNFNTPILNSNIQNIEIPKNVTLIDTSNNLAVNNTLVNYGDIVFASNGTIISNNIINGQSGQISASASLDINSPAIFNEGEIYSTYGMTFNTTKLFNSGTIETSSNNLNLCKGK